MPKDPRSVQQVSGTAAAKKANYTGGRPKDESKLSQDPRQIRIRLRRAARGNKKRDGRMERDIEMLYQKPIDEWDLEELAHGRPRNPEDGTFRGAIPKWITPAIQREAKKRLMEETFGKLAGHMSTAMDVLKDLMLSEEVDDKGKPIVDARTKLAAATFIIEHVIGKPKAIFEVQTDETTRQAIAAAIVLDDGEVEDHFIIDGSVVEDDEELGDDTDLYTEEELNES